MDLVEVLLYFFLLVVTALIYYFGYLPRGSLLSMAPGYGVRLTYWGLE